MALLTDPGQSVATILQNWARFWDFYRFHFLAQLPPRVARKACYSIRVSVVTDGDTRATAVEQREP